jgi:hypothetical protein
LRHGVLREQLIERLITVHTEPVRRREGEQSFRRTREHPRLDVQSRVEQMAPSLPPFPESVGEPLTLSFSDGQFEPFMG